MPVVGLVGYGNMGSALVKCWLDDGVQPDLIKVVDHHPERVQEMGLTPASYEDLDTALAIILAVKPDSITEAIQQAKFQPDALIVSMAAGISLQTLASVLPENQPACRIMPNIGVRIGHGALAITYNKHVKVEHKDAIQEILKPLGKILVFPEKNFDIVTALIGSAPAFVALLLDSGISGGVLGGLNKERTTELLLETINSTVKLIESGMSCEEIKYMVSSPAGSTIEGLKVLEQAGIKGHIMNCILQTGLKAKELGLNNNRATNKPASSV